MFTNNERKVLRFLMTSLSYKSINDIAKECSLAPNGAYKILKKLEKLGIIYYEDVGRIKAYKINFDNNLTLSYLEIALTDERVNESKIKIRIRDFEELKKICKTAIIIGSYITDNKNPNDIDIVFVFDKDKFNIFRKTLDKATEIIPYKIHDIIQTPQDMVNNLKRQDKIIITAIKDGVILWGHDFIARSIKNVQTQ
ncbi:MAG: winged helix-turn-helix domain-containing protein [Nanoarchaeota archaeon]